MEKELILGYIFIGIIVIITISLTIQIGNGFIESRKMQVCSLELRIRWIDCQVNDICEVPLCVEKFKKEKFVSSIQEVKDDN